MTPLQKARKLVAKYGHATAIIIAEEFIDCFEDMVFKGWVAFADTLKYWNQVKEEIIKHG